VKIFVSAAEISSDIHAAAILKALIEKVKDRGETVEIAGIGGPRLRALPHFRCLEQAENLRAMGFVEVFAKFSFFKKTISRTADFIASFQPDLILTFDYPDFHLTLLKRVKRRNLAPKALKICGIPPKVWVWRSHRVEKIRALYDGVWVILPFEKEFYEARGIPVIYHGNLLIADLLSDDSRVEVDSKSQGVVVMPGSREGELRYHLPLVGPTLELLAKKIKRPVHALVPIPKGLSAAEFSQALQSSRSVTYTFHLDQAGSCLRSAPIGLIKSGTSTLEAAVLGCVPVIFYKLNVINEWIFRLFIRYLGPVGLPNILLGMKDRLNLVFPEVLGPEANPENLADHLFRLLNQPQILAEKKQAGESLIAALVPKSKSVSQDVANELLEWQSFARTPESEKPSSAFILVGSKIWSSLNWFRRRVYLSGILKQVKFPIPSILVGNLQAGGSGKTPIVIELVREARARNLKVAVVSRGYGRDLKGKDATEVILRSGAVDPSETGDEPAEILSLFPAVIVGIGSDRLKTVTALREAHPDLQLLIFDDGFQNLKFKTTVTLLAITEHSSAQVLYRDFLSEAKFADLKIHRKSWFWKSAKLPEIPLILLCGVGDPDAVADYYLAQGANLLRTIFKKDHAQFEKDEVKVLLEGAVREGARVAVTPKDLVKLKALGFTENDFVVLSRELASKVSITRVFDRLFVGLQS
jgi:lipid-A-disaccharide synthase